jgi:hypothetical protein
MNRIALLFKRKFPGIKKCQKCKSLFVAVSTRVKGDYYRAHCHCNSCKKDWYTGWWSLPFLMGKPIRSNCLPDEGDIEDDDDWD